VLLPAAFRWRDPKTQLVHHGAVVQRGDETVIGFTTLCTEVLGAKWDDAQPDEPAMIDCLQCLGAREQEG
jgi:hypothetical protein